jgi:ribose 5-phosphate isomerase B
MKIYLAADHAGFELKEKIKNNLKENNYDIEDCGAFSFDQNDDYPDFISKAAEKVSKDQNAFAIVFGKSGAGEEIVANKFKGVRCVLGFCDENVRLSREHNNANVLSLGSAFVDFESAKTLTGIFLKTSFSGEDRHVRRINKIREIEQKNYA